MLTKLLDWFAGLFAGRRTTQIGIGKGNQSVNASTTGQNSPVLSAGNDMHVHIGDPQSRFRSDIAASHATDQEQLSAEAEQLLREAIQDPKGCIKYWGRSHAHSLFTNGKDFLSDNSPQSIALWRGVLMELKNRDLIEDREGNDEIFFVTAQGFK